LAIDSVRTSPPPPNSPAWKRSDTVGSKCAVSNFFPLLTAIAPLTMIHDFDNNTLLGPTSPTAHVEYYSFVPSQTPVPLGFRPDRGSSSPLRLRGTPPRRLFFSTKAENLSVLGQVVFSPLNPFKQPEVLSTDCGHRTSYLHLCHEDAVTFFTFSPGRTFFLFNRHSRFLHVAKLLRPSPTIPLRPLGDS